MQKRVFTVIGILIALAVIVSVSSSFSETALAKETQRIGANENAQPQAVFTNPASITIQDQDAANPYPSAITVSGISGSIPATPGSVKVTLNGYSHTFSNDVAIVLVGPTGAALLLQDGAGDSPDMVNVTYTLSDTGSAFLPDLTAWPAGTYKPTSYFTGDDFPPPGPGTTYNNPGPAGGGSATFSSTFGGTNANGVWNLYVVDFVGGDVGSISGGWTLEIVSAAPVNDVPVDFNADGRTDFVVTRQTTPGINGVLTWLTQFNLGNPSTTTDWGFASDQVIPADFDGDQKDDFAIFRPLAEAQFHIVRSASMTMYSEQFGTAGDDATVVGDYNADNIDDLAVYRAGATPGATSTWFYKSVGAPEANFTGIEWGVNGDFPAPGDYDGDNRYDFVVQRPDANGINGRFFKRLTTGVLTSEMFGLANDVIVPGDYDGDGKTDIAVVRNDGGIFRWDFEPSGTAGTTVVTDTWGILASGDYITQGDYDGDGKTDYAVWRPGNPATFHMMTVGTRFISSKLWGVTGDIPAANYNEH